jgi:Holliday junction resolvasome RuvABC endonuclease subunit
VKILGLDLSLVQSGVAIVEDGRLAAMVPIRSSKLPPGASAAATTERLDEIARRIAGVVMANGPDVVAIEGYSYGSSASQAHSTGELGGAVRLWLWRNHYRDIVEWPPKQWRKYLFDNGNLDKELVRIRVARRFAVELADVVDSASLDELEAWCVAYSEWIRRSEGFAGPPAKLERAPRRRKPAAA